MSMAVLKAAKERWQVLSPLRASLYWLLDCTPQQQIRGLNVGNENGEKYTIERFERARVSSMNTREMFSYFVVGIRWKDLDQIWECK